MEEARIYMAIVITGLFMAWATFYVTIKTMPPLKVEFTNPTKLVGIVISEEEEPKDEVALHNNTEDETPQQ